MMLASRCIAVSPLRSSRLLFFIKKAYYHHEVKNTDLFNDKNWIVKRPQFLNLPKNERSKLDTFEFNFSKGENDNVYLQNASFKDNLDKAMQFVYNEKLSSLDAKQVPIKNLAWLKLRDSIYSQLKHPRKQPSAYVPSLGELIHLSNQVT